MYQQIQLPLSFDRPTGPADWANRLAQADTAEQADAILRTIEKDIAGMEAEAGLPDLLERCGIRRSLPEILPGEWYNHIGRAEPRHRMRLAQAYNLAQSAFREHGCHAFGKIADPIGAYGSAAAFEEPEYCIAV
jgi:hypothetical protein